MAHLKWYGVLIVFRTVNSTTIGAVTRIHTVNRGWKDRSGERKTEMFSPEHTNNFILTILITQREVQWGAQVKEPGEDKRHKSR